MFPIKETPGPGQYNPENNEFKHIPAYKFTSTFNTVKHKEIPGPGHYFNKEEEIKIFRVASK